jgi:hypothetical protein
MKRQAEQAFKMDKENKDHLLHLLCFKWHHKIAACLGKLEKKVEALCHILNGDPVR